MHRASPTLEKGETKGGQGGKEEGALQAILAKKEVELLEMTERLLKDRSRLGTRRTIVAAKSRGVG
eukprot:174953-Lingulodinium_polyedra.AAC.1